MTKFIYSLLTVVCIGSAMVLSLPMPSSASFAIGGDGCTHHGRKDITCGSSGATDCTSKYKVCDSDGDHVTICTEGGGTNACTLTGCVNANQATTDNNCDS
jgi:hypothetical protein